MSLLQGKDITVNHVNLMSYCWPNEKFDCVVGVWSLSSVKLDQVENLLVKIDQSMQVLGHLVLIEPVLDKNEK